MNLATAQRYADQILAWLAPYCEYAEIAGSIRRRRPICNDVDIVCIPKTGIETVQVDMFTTEQRSFNLLRRYLDTYIGDGSGAATWLQRESSTIRKTLASPKPDAINLLIQLRKCQLDIFCATEKTWATLNLCRTGSREHNIWLCERAKTFGLHWNPYRGLDRNGDLLDTPTEESIYAALNLPFIAPENRELDYLRRLPCR